MFKTYNALINDLINDDTRSLQAHIQQGRKVGELLVTASRYAALTCVTYLINYLSEKNQLINKTDLNSALISCAYVNRHPWTAGFWPSTTKENERLEIAKTLIQAGANLNSQDNDGQSPLHMAARCEFYEMVELLCQNGAYVNQKNNMGYTPLHVHVAECCPEDTSIVYLLYTQGASLRTENNQGVTISSSALCNGQEALYEYLIGLEEHVSGKINRHTRFMEDFDRFCR